MPQSIYLILALLLLLSSLFCIFLPLCLNLRRIYLSPGQNVQTEPATKELGSTLLGVLTVDLLLYLLYRSTMPKGIFYPLIMGLNALSLSFICHSYLSWWCYRRSLRTALNSIPIVAIAHDMQSSHHP